MPAVGPATVLQLGQTGAYSDIKMPVIYSIRGILFD